MAQNSEHVITGFNSIDLYFVEDKGVLKKVVKQGIGGKVPEAAYVQSKQ